LISVLDWNIIADLFMSISSGVPYESPQFDTRKHESTNTNVPRRKHEGTKTRHEGNKTKTRRYQDKNYKGETTKILNFKQWHIGTITNRNYGNRKLKSIIFVYSFLCLRTFRHYMYVRIIIKFICRYVSYNELIFPYSDVSL
jgi:hypothetical protein